MSLPHMVKANAHAPDRYKDTLQEHDFQAVRGGHVLGSVKRICVKCGLETFQELRCMTAPCRPLPASDQLALLEEVNREPVVRSSRRWFDRLLVAGSVGLFVVVSLPSLGGPRLLDRVSAVLLAVIVIGVSVGYLGWLRARRS